MSWCRRATRHGADAPCAVPCAVVQTKPDNQAAEAEAEGGSQAKGQVSQSVRAKLQQFLLGAFAVMLVDRWVGACAQAGREAGGCACVECGAGVRAGRCTCMQ